MKLYTPGTVVQATDRRYIADHRGSLRVLDYEPAPPEPIVLPTPAPAPVEMGDAA